MPSTVGEVEHGPIPFVVLFTLFPKLYVLTSVKRIAFYCKLEEVISFFSEQTFLSRGL